MADKVLIREARSRAWIERHTIEGHVPHVVKLGDQVPLLFITALGLHTQPRVVPQKEVHMMPKVEHLDVVKVLRTSVQRFIHLMQMLHTGFAVLVTAGALRLELGDQL